MRRLFLCLAILISIVSPARAAAPFELRDGDRVVLLGDTFIEREQHNGWIEVMLTTRFPDRNITFRNLGWSADSPVGDSRFGLSLLQAGLEPGDEGWKQLQAQIELTKPTVVFLGYGMASSFAGEIGLPRFKEELGRLTGAISRISPGVRFVFVSPIRHEKLASPFPDPAAHNADLEKYVAAIREAAAAQNAPFVNLFDTVVAKSKSVASRPLTDNGIHLNAAGYRKAAVSMEKELGWNTGAWQKSALAEGLRQRVLRKNEWFFHRSRPANMAYIFGFRKKEQGQNAIEIPKFDPLIAAEEAVISQLRALKPSSVPDLTPRVGASTAKFTRQPHPNFEVGEGLEVKLWAENPLLHKPIQMNFDPQGRLWVASSEIYPQIEPGQAKSDKIVVLEDTDGDGIAEKSTVFVDGLLIPTGVIPGDGGVYVAQSTELLHFKDTNGDSKADVSKLVLSSFGTEDTHHNLHTLRWGHDGNLYMSQSIYTRSDVETPSGVVRLKSGGVLQLRPDSLKMDILFRGWINSWGHQFDEFGQSFLTDGAGGGGINWGLPGAMYVTYAKARRILGSVSPGSYPKFAGVELVYSKAFPDDWQGNVVTCDFRAHRVVRFGMSEEGSAYVTKEMPDLLRTTDDSFRPIDVKMGPDGAIYVADWSNPIIQHGEVDFRDSRRDREHGRIWRISYKGRPKVARPSLVKASNADLLDDLKSTESFTRDNARRVLTERGSKVLSPLKSWTAKQTDEKALLNALWMYQSYDKVEPVLMYRLLAADDGRVRAAAVRVLSEWHGRVGDSLSDLEKLVADPHPRVRLEAVRALANIKSAKAAEIALRVLDKPMDNFLDYALWLTVNDLAEPWLAAVKSGQWNPDGREKHLEFGLKAVEPALAGDALAQLFANKAFARDGKGPWIELIGQAGGVAELRKMYDQVLAGGFDANASVRALNALSEAARLRNARPSGDLATLAGLTQDKNESIRVAAVKLAGSWRMGNLAGGLLEIVGNVQSKDALRDAAFESLRQIGGQGVVAGLKKTIASAASDLIRKEAVLALAGLNLNQAVPDIAE
ncbi:MAG TPA: PVC-type heme-binding CxxCH protein, partial [Roseimicrobium sp.]|nr:PVC-type heme-binding CxxCH protein [Roseimicrobium sp.]